MIIYVIIAFVAILIGMAISVSAFGTGGKRKKIFQDIYFSVEDVDGIGVLYTKTGEYSAILKMENPVQKYSANIDSYYEFNHLVTALAQTLGEGYAIHKQDVFVRKQFQDESNDNHEFLSESYFKYFNGRSYTDSQTYLIITQENKKSRIFSFDSKKWRDFVVKIRKVKDQLKDSGVEASYLDGNTAREYVDRYFSMNFNDKVVAEVRKDEQRRLYSEGRKEEARMLKNTKYILTSNRQTLRKKDDKAKEDRKANIETKIFDGGKQKETRGGNEELYDALLKENKLLFLSDMVKEKLSHAYTLDDECIMAKEITEIIDICNDSGNKHFRWFSNLLEKHFEGIIAHGTYKISSGKVEGTNNLIKTVRRKAYGYRDNDYFFLKIMDESRREYVRNPKSHKNYD